MGRFLSEPEYLNHTLVLGMISDYDGDAMHGVSIKELQMIPALMNMHPANVLLAGDDIRITSDVMITKEAAIALNGYINDPRQFDEAE